MAWCTTLSDSLSDAFDAVLVIQPSRSDPQIDRLFDVEWWNCTVAIFRPKDPNTMVNTCNHAHDTARTCFEAFKALGTRAYFRTYHFTMDTRNALCRMPPLVRKLPNMITSAGWPKIGIHRIGNVFGPHRVMIDPRLPGSVRVHNCEQVCWGGPTWVAAALYPDGVPMILSKLQYIDHVPMAAL